MIVEYIRYNVDSDDTDRLISAFSAAGAHFSAFPGCKRWELARQVSDEGTFVARIDWESPDAIEAFKSTAGFNAVLSALRPYADAGRLELFRSVAGSSDPAAT